MKVTFEKKTKRDAALTVRISADALRKLKALAEKNGVSQADVIEKLILLAK